MKRNILVSLISNETIPNVQLIKEFRSDIDEYVFVYTKEMISQLGWVKTVTGIVNSTDLLIDPFDLKAMEDELKNREFGDHNYVLNLTGGTKPMIIAFYDFFRNLGATIYYLTGKKFEYIKVFPAIGNRKLSLTTKISLDEYFKAYGFNTRYSTLVRDKLSAIKIKEYFVANDMDRMQLQISKIREKRGKKLDFRNDLSLQNFIDEIGFVPKEAGVLAKEETKYLSGDWFEEFVYYSIKDELGIEDSDIATGMQIEKQNTPNELDIAFIHENKLFIIECKTSILESQIRPDGKSKERNLLPEVIYKSDALRNKFGIFAKTFILTLDEIKDINNVPKDRFKASFDRAELSRISILSKRDFLSSDGFREMLRIN